MTTGRPIPMLRLLIATAALGVALAAPAPAAADSGSGRQPTARSAPPRASSPATAQPRSGTGDAPPAVGRTPQPREAQPGNPDNLSQRPQHQPSHDPRADHRPDGTVRYPSYAHVYIGPGYYSPYGWYPWGYWGGGLHYSPYPWGFGAYHRRGYGDELGALDLDLRPEKAEVYLDGQRIGLADDFDGWPRYLWLEGGTYDLVFYHPGYETISREYTIYSGVVIDVEDQMVQGEATPPSELAPTLAERRAERQRERGRDELPEWLERAKRGRAEAGTRSEAGAAGAYDARSAAAILKLEVEPDDAAVYLDGRFLGPAGSLLAGGRGLKIDAGEHELEIARPGYASEVRRFTVEPGEEIELEVELTAE